MRMCDWLVSTSSSTEPSDSAHVSSTVRWSLSSARYRSTPVFCTDPSRPERTSIRPDQSSAITVVSSAAACSNAIDSEAPLGQLRGAAGVVAEACPADQHAASQVECLVVVEDLDVVDAEPRPIVDAEREHQPVRHVDQALVVDRLSVGHVAGPAVVDAGEVRARVVGAVRVRLRRCTSRRHIAVADRAQRFTLSFLGGVVAVVAPRPFVGVSRSGMPRGAVVASRVDGHRHEHLPRRLCPCSRPTERARRGGRVASRPSPAVSEATGIRTARSPEGRPSTLR
jgi:hypothetical protein